MKKLKTKYDEMDIEGMSDEEYEAIKKKMLRYSISSIASGVLLAVVVLFLLLCLKW